MLLFLSSQCLTLGSSFPYNLIKNVYFLATFILINSVCLLTIKIPGSQCLGTGMTGEGGYLNDTILFPGLYLIGKKRRAI
ncbi:hypothetical protein [Wolbachia endosymbiont (group A) of Anomoia purmunda]|uniref:hypothetical protein n=1 Tax=Wolbachia endosymbiont (group A) of Anomoia purmunda TaxID=2953978 RepID=UPI0022328A09|nr:hypothetical protein [Wolbachia endosymbiont (group A) of Anomoia purmunda]